MKGRAGLSEKEGAPRGKGEEKRGCKLRETRKKEKGEEILGEGKAKGRRREL